MIYCPGEFCEKRDTCKYHLTEGLAQVLDWSTYGSGRWCSDSEGNSHSECTFDCGDNGNYKKYEEVKKVRKQYRSYECPAFRYNVVRYHNGVEVDCVRKWLGDELDEYVDELKKQGYTYGYTKEEVEEARLRYERLYKNIIEWD